MRTFILAAVLVALPLAAQANTVTAKVDGMVCAFCAKGLEDKLHKDASVGTVKISLDDGTVVVTSKDGKTITEDVVSKAVDYMGYKVVSIKSKP